MCTKQFSAPVIPGREQFADSERRSVGSQIPGAFRRFPASSRIHRPFSLRCVENSTLSTGKSFGFAHRTPTTKEYLLRPEFRALWERVGHKTR